MLPQCSKHKFGWSAKVEGGRLGRLPAGRKRIRPIIVIDDHELAHSGIRLLLADNSDFVLVGTFSRARDGIDFLSRHPGTLTLLDLELPDVDGLTALSEIVACGLGSVILLTGVTRPEALRKGRDLGAAGIVCKGDPIEESLTALHVVAGGGQYFSRCAQELLDKSCPAAVELSARQSIVLQLLANGCSNKEIAYRMEISAPTVSFHLAEIRRKLGAENSRQLVDMARAKGLLANSST